MLAAALAALRLPGAVCNKKDVLKSVQWYNIFQTSVLVACKQ